jgi:hypothetical protein
VILERTFICIRRAVNFSSFSIGSLENSSQLARSAQIVSAKQISIHGNRRF